MKIQDAIIQGLLGKKIRRKNLENSEFDYYTIDNKEFVGHIIEDGYTTYGAQLSFEDIIADDWEIEYYEENLRKKYGKKYF